MSGYKALKLFVRYGFWLAIAVIVGGLLLAGWLTIASGLSFPLLIAFLVSVFVGGFFILVFLDLTKLMAEMLLPR